MSSPFRGFLCFMCLSFIAACAQPSQEAPPAPLEYVPAEEGAFFDVAKLEDANGVAIRLPAPDETGVSLRMIHATGVAAGLGSNPVGLDRGFNGGGRIIAFRRAGDKVLVEEENWRYRASADNPLEKQAVLDSFARSLLWAGEVRDENADGSYTVDISGLLITDMLDLRGWLDGRGQGNFSISDERSFIDTSSVLVFPDNVEVDVVMTLTSDAPGGEVRATAANPRSVTLTIHHSFVRLPDDGYKPRVYDPRSGAIDISFYDFSSPLDAPIVKRFARRFRLERVDPNAASGPVKKPIVFYVDAGAPEQVRNALVEGATWWADAFEGAGFEDAFRIEVLPEGAHPFDVRYNVIQWTHRQTRGWSYGGGIADPRTGEMLKGHVILGSQRVRQDRMIFEGLIGADGSGSGDDDDPVELALARIRQLSAHEVGHPLGFAHNFAASQNDRASVMDYPAPLVRPAENGALDVSGAYAVGIGDWDRFTVKWLYSEFPEGNEEQAALAEIIEEAYGAGLKFVADGEGRSVGAGHPDGSVWDNGDDPVAMLDETMRVRRIALDSFGLRNIKSDRPVSDLQSVIVPIYLYHRYQVAAAAKLIGGYRFSYSVKGDGTAGGVPVSQARQRAALTSLLATLDPAALNISTETLNLLTPGASTFSSVGRGETFTSDISPIFDLTRAVDAAGAVTIDALLHPRRLGRLIEMKRRSSTALGVEDLLTVMEARIFNDARAGQAEIARTLQTRYVSTLISIAAGDDAGAAVKARVDAHLKKLRNTVSPNILEGLTPDRAHREWLIARIDRHFERPAPALAAKAKQAEIPPGSPIGTDLGESCWHCDSTF
ncbi:MAG: zinc-dependent metalloprotease [Pseudomonadota bacterium]